MTREEREEFERIVSERSEDIQLVVSRYFQLVVDSINRKRKFKHPRSRNPYHWVDSRDALRFLEEKWPEAAKLVRQRPVMRNG